MRSKQVVGDPSGRGFNRWTTRGEGIYGGMDMGEDIHGQHDEFFRCSFATES